MTRSLFAHLARGARGNRKTPGVAAVPTGAPGCRTGASRVANVDVDDGRPDSAHASGSWAHERERGNGARGHPMRRGRVDGVRRVNGNGYAPGVHVRVDVRDVR